MIKYAVVSNSSKVLLRLCAVSSSEDKIPNMGERQRQKFTCTIVPKSETNLKISEVYFIIKQKVFEIFKAMKVTIHFCTISRSLFKQTCATDHVNCSVQTVRFSSFWRNSDGFERRRIVRFCWSALCHYSKKGTYWILKNSRQYSNESSFHSSCYQ